MEAKKIDKPKAKINPMKLNINPPNKEIKNTKIAEILQLLGIEEDSKDYNNHMGMDNDPKKNSWDKMDKDDNSNVKEKLLVKENVENSENESSNENSNDSFEKILDNLSIAEEKGKKVEINKENVNIRDELNSNNNDQIRNTKIIPVSNYIIKNIDKDGNCFYRTISYYYRNSQEDYKEFREIISSYILNNPDEYIFAVTDEDIKVDDNIDELIKIQKKENI